jgi:hypothetical protein
MSRDQNANIKLDNSSFERVGTVQIIVNNHKNSKFYSGRN